MDQLAEDIRRLLEREDLTAAQVHVRLVGLLLRENRRYQAQLEATQHQLAAEQRLRLQIEASRQSLLALGQALWQEARQHPDQAAHPLAHSAALRQRLYDRAYRQEQMRAGSQGQPLGGATDRQRLPPAKPLNDSPRPARD